MSSEHFEWAGVEDCTIEIVPKDFSVVEWDVVDPEDRGSRKGLTEGPSIIMGGGGGGAIVITGERRDQLVEFARTLLRMTEDDERANADDEEDDEVFQCPFNCVLVHKTSDELDEHLRRFHADE